MTAKKVELQLRVVKPASLKDIPAVFKNGLIRNLDEFKDLETIARHVQTEGTSPFEAFDIVNFAELKKHNKDAANMKTLAMSFIQKARAVLKEFQVDKKLELRQRKDRLYLVSTE